MEDVHLDAEHQALVMEKCLDQSIDVIAMDCLALQETVGAYVIVSSTVTEELWKEIFVHKVNG